MAFVQDTGSSGVEEWYPNWIDNLLRNDRKSVGEVWIATFRNDFCEWLRSEKMRTYVLEEFLASDMRLFHLDLEQFRKHSTALFVERWTERFKDNPKGIPLMPSATPFNSGSVFLEFFFVRLIKHLKEDICYLVKQIAKEASEKERASDGNLTEQVVMDRAFDLNVINLLSAEKDTRGSFELKPRNAFALRNVKDLKPDDCTLTMRVSGTVTRMTDIKPELTSGSFKCQACSNEMRNVEQEFRLTEPNFCTRRNCGNRSKWELIETESIFSDWQKIKLQQDVSTGDVDGSIPRSIDVVIRGSGVDTCKPGDHVIVIGSVIPMPDVSSLMNPNKLPKSVVAEKRQQIRSDTGGMYNEGVMGLSKIGVRELHHRMMLLASEIEGGSTSEVLRSNAAQEFAVHDFILSPTPKTEIEIAEFEKMRRNPLLKNTRLDVEQHQRFKLISMSIECLEILQESIAQDMHGYTDLKKGLLLMLVGGVEKRTKKDGIKLRGDVNVLIVGDPGTGKSQFLKFIHNFADKAVLASGKNSTAAGLTASVHKDAETGESVVEAGALILADTGICCIDEFEKMASHDQVAIHEAMEQQTISISKAGIQATMNARASVLAACTPNEGKFDGSRSLRENLKLPPTILSRFDLIFSLKDVQETGQELHDRALAKHILMSHSKNVQKTISPFALKDEKELKQYCTIAKSFKPILSAEARDILATKYVSLRGNKATGQAMHSRKLTIRQLEAMIRLSEAVARLAFSDSVLPNHARVAGSLFEQALGTMHEKDVQITALLQEETDNEDAFDGSFSISVSKVTVDFVHAVYLDLLKQRELEQILFYENAASLPANKNNRRRKTPDASQAPPPCYNEVELVERYFNDCRIEVLNSPDYEQIKYVHRKILRHLVNQAQIWEREDGSLHLNSPRLEAARTNGNTQASSTDQALITEDVIADYFYIDQDPVAT